MNRRELKQAGAYLRAENAKYGDEFLPIPREQWPKSVAGQRKVLRSKNFLVQVFDEEDGAIRLSICRTRLLASGRWDDGISWDELQHIKNEAGFESRWAVEIFPSKEEVVNVANMRHLFVLPHGPAYAWKRKRESA